MKIFKVKEMRNKAISISFIVSIFLTLVFSSVASINSSFVHSTVDTLGFVQTIRSSDDEYCFAHYKLDGENTFAKAKTELSQINSISNLGIREGCAPFISSSLESGQPISYKITYDEKDLELKSNVLTINNLCYELKDNGCLFGIPFKPHFDQQYFKNKRIGCDINYEYGKKRDGGSYITDEFADYLLSLDEALSSYDDLLGKTYKLSFGSVEKEYTINNVISTHDYAGKSVFDYYGRFIVTNDNSIFDETSTSLYLGINHDLFSCFDLMNYFKVSKHKLLSLKIKENGEWKETKELDVIKTNILEDVRWNFNVYQMVFLVLSIASLVFTVIFLKELFARKLISRCCLIIGCSILFVILLAVNIVFLFIPKFYSVIRIINLINILPLEIMLFYCLFKLVFMKREKDEHI